MSLPENISLLSTTVHMVILEGSFRYCCWGRGDGVKVHLMNIEHIDWDALDASHGIIFGSPTYMGSMTADFKSLWTVLLNVGKSVCGKESLQLDLQTQVV